MRFAEQVLVVLMDAVLKSLCSADGHHGLMQVGRGQCNSVVWEEGKILKMALPARGKGR